MTTKMTEKEWLQEFSEFAGTEEIQVPKEISDSILNTVKKALNPSAWLVFAKLFALHSLVGTASLALCNQFGMNPFHTNFSLSDYFMTFGHSTCMVLCGIIFIGLSVLASRFLLSKEEFLVMRRNVGLQIFSLSMISLGLLLLAGAQIAFSIGVLWLLGAIISGISITVALQPKTYQYS